MRKLPATLNHSPTYARIPRWIGRTKMMLYSRGNLNARAAKIQIALRINRVMNVLPVRLFAPRMSCPMRSVLANSAMVISPCSIAS